MDKAQIKGPKRFVIFLKNLKSYYLNRTRSRYLQPLFSSIDPSLKLQFLVVKTSSLGDIIQSFSVLNYLKAKFPNAEIDWVVEKSFSSVVAAHPLVRSAIAIDLKGMKKRWRFLSQWKQFILEFKSLRKKRYELILDLQGNCKSGLVTLFSKGGVKVGFDFSSAREWPNILGTDLRFYVPKEINIRLQYLRLVQQFFKDTSPCKVEGLRFLIEKEEREKLQQILSSLKLQTKIKVMVCPGSKWINKQLKLETLTTFLQNIQKDLAASFLLMWGDEEEKAFCEKLQENTQSIIVERLSIPSWQNLMNEVDLVIAVDSSALHLCGTTSTPSFSVFGPTSPDIFKPIGHLHFAFRGKCPYNRSFIKMCPVLRACETGACIRDLKGEEIYLSFKYWWKSLSQERQNQHFLPR